LGPRNVLIWQKFPREGGEEGNDTWNLNGDEETEKNENRSKGGKRMKKYLVWIGAVVMVMAVASPLLAQGPMPPYTYGPANTPSVAPTSLWKSWGHMEIATYWINKPDFGQGGSSGYASGTGVVPTVTKLGEDNTIRQITERFRFYLQYGDPKTVRGVIGFEADSQNWGESRYTPGEPRNSLNELNPSGAIGTYRTDQVQLEVKHAFIEFVIPNTPVTLTAGLQGVNIGDARTGYQNDAPGITIKVDFAPHAIFGYWWRERDVDTLLYNTNDMYALRYMLFQKLFNVDVWGIYRNGDAGLANSVGWVSDPRYADHPWWLGLNGGFRPGNWDFSGSFIYDGGKQEARVAGLSDRNYSGWLADLAATYRIGPGLAATLEAYYATGNDADSNDIKAYTYQTGTESVYAMGTSRSVFFMYNLDFMYYNMKYLMTTGMYYGRANIEYNPVPWVNLNFNYLYYGDTAKGTPGALKQVNSPTGAQQNKDEDYIGSELNVIARIKIYEPLYYNIGLGYFIPGAVYDHYNALGQKDRSPDNAWSFLTCLRYAF
jgi:hypothetical protein